VTDFFDIEMDGKTCMKDAKPGGYKNNEQILSRRLQGPIDIINCIPIKLNKMSILIDIESDK
jgi:hypothetical protein